MLERDRDVNVKTEFFGDKGYGFTVCTELLENKNEIIVYSFGIGEDLSFSEHLVKTYPACRIFAFDPTPKSIKYVDMYDKSNFSHFEFYPVGLSDKNGYTKFFLPKNKDYVSGSEYLGPTVDENDTIEVEMNTLDKLMTQLNHSYIDLLKMDIEGTEFFAVPDILSKEIKIEQICVEVHNRFYEDGEERLQNMLKAFSVHGYKLVHVSDNEEELLFVKMN